MTVLTKKTGEETINRFTSLGNWGGVGPNGRKGKLRSRKAVSL